MTEEHYLISLKITARCSCFQCSFEIVSKGGKGERRVSSPPKVIQAPFHTCPESVTGAFQMETVLGKAECASQAWGCAGHPACIPASQSPP